MENTIDKFRAATPLINPLHKAMSHRTIFVRSAHQKRIGCSIISVADFVIQLREYMSANNINWSQVKSSTIYVGSVPSAIVQHDGSTEVVYQINADGSRGAEPIFRYSEYADRLEEHNKVVAARNVLLQKREEKIVLQGEKVAEIIESVLAASALNKDVTVDRAPLDAFIADPGKYECNLQVCVLAPATNTLKYAADIGIVRPYSDEGRYRVRSYFINSAPSNDPRGVRQFGKLCLAVADLVEALESAISGLEPVESCLEAIKSLDEA